ncbi:MULTISPECIES: hypothetical protein [unclassified Sphingopyxis]|uniref:hypothetical protein n=1 Tax=unclassified Sphingopyxis TaxID=2614943 RepID=UPI0012DC82B4|nr:MULTISPECIES: hypothetical protein [unclassified Sphingopyxis]
MGQSSSSSHQPSATTQSLSSMAAARTKSTERLVTTALGDSWSTLDAEVALIDRLFGCEIAALFERE